MTATREAKEKHREEVSAMFASVAKRYDITNDVLSFGVHRLWKKSLLKFLPPVIDKDRNSSPILDLATGTGDLLPLIHKEGLRVVGGDYSKPMLEVARKRGFANFSELIQCDAASLPFPDNEFAGVVISFGVRNFSDLPQSLNEIHRVLKDNGRLIVLEFGQPSFTPWRIIYQQYQKHLMPFIGGLLTGNFAAYRYLPETSQAFPSGKAFGEILNTANFKVVMITPLFGGIAYRYIADKPISRHS